jgi:S-methyl-5-thioribose-1-phosphate isomerase
MRTVDWHHDHIVIVDQTLLPHRLEMIALRTVDGVIDALQRLAVRGAPAIGVTGALAVAMAARIAGTDEQLRTDAARVRAARPTAVNLAWAVDRVMALAPHGAQRMLDEAVAMLDEDIATNRALSHHGADWIERRVVARSADGYVLHTHCNAGGLACVEWGTALGVVRALHERGRVTEVFVDETRPLLQGARLTAWELQQTGIPYRVVADGAAASIVARGLIDVAVVGADRITANGDVVNKIGTYPLALACARAGVPLMVAAPESTRDPRTATGGDVHIEERAEHEVLFAAGVRVAPDGAHAANPAFDVTPSDLVTVTVTETGAHEGTPR